MNFAAKFVRNTFLAGAAAVGAGFGVSTLAGLALWSLYESRKFNLRDRIVVITGGSRGLGLALARVFLSRGAKVALLARDPEELDRARQSLAGMGTVFVRPCDVRDQQQVNDAIVEIRRELGEIDVLVNNAGTITVGPLDTMSIDDYREALNIYFWASLYTTLAVLPSMRQRRSGRIANISSIGGKISVPHLLPYSVGKFALAGFSEGLRSELIKENVRVTTVYPGLMRTGSARNAEFKGKHRAEYAWFLLSDSIPGIAINSDRAARQIVNACERGKAELIVSLPAEVAIKIHALFPSISLPVLALMNRALPDAQGGIETSKKGSESETRLTQSWLRTFDERAAVKNNQLA
jgi:short-subunit dehydrogenase